MKNVFAFVVLYHSSLFASAQIKNQANWQQQVSYHINVSLDDTKHELNGDILIGYWNNSPDTLSYIYMHLWPNAYSSDKSAFAIQQIENDKLAFHHSSSDERGSISGLNFMTGTTQLRWEFTNEVDVAIVYLDKPLAPGEHTSISTPFKVDLPLVFSRLGHDNQDYYITQWYPKPAVYDVNGWNPMPYLDQGEFYSEFGSFEVNITLPKNYIVAATGNLQTESEIAFRKERMDKKRTSFEPIASSEELKTITFTADSVHDFAWFASKMYNIASSSIEIDGRTIETFVYSYQYSPQYLEPIKTALKYYSRYVGPYPYSHASVVKGELKAGGGMEYPMITVCDIMMDEVIIHEVGHNWFYGVLGSNERIYPWMDESINSFYDNAGETGSLMNNSESAVYDVFYKDAILANEVQPIGSPSDEFTDNNYGVIVYGMGPRAFGYLKEYLGALRYDSAMRFYYEKWKFKHPLPDDMKAAFEESTGEDLTWFFEDVLNTNKKMDYGLKNKNGKPILYNNGETNAPIPVAYPMFGKMQINWYRLEPGEEMILDIDEKVSQLKIDPSGMTTDFFIDNDAMKSGLVVKPFIGKDIKGRKELYLAPSIGWNGHDAFMLGILFHNYSFSNKPFQFFLSPMYATGSENITGLGALNYHLSGNGPGAGMDLNLRAQRFSTAFQTSSFLYTKVSPTLQINFARSSYRSKLNKSMKFGYSFINFDPNFNLEKARAESWNSNFQTLNNWQFLTAEYKIENKRTLNAYMFSFEIEQGLTSNKILHGDSSIQGLDTLFILTSTSLRKSNHTKLTAIVEYSLDIGIDKKPIQFRAYFSYFLDTAENGFFDHRISNAGMIRDYRFDELAFFRNADSGLFANQIANGKEKSKFVGILGQSNRMLFNFNVSLPLPGKIPLRPYIELMTFTDIANAPFNNSMTGMIYNLGIEVLIIPSVLSVYVNLAQSKDVNEWQSTPLIDKGKFAQRITFSLDLNGLTPTEVKKEIKLF